MAVSKLKNYHPGERIIEKGEEADALFILIKGKVEVLLFDSHQKLVTVSIEEGTPFGEMGLLENIPRSNTCLASENSEILVIQIHSFKELPEGIRLKFISEIAIILAHRLRSMNDKITRILEKQNLPMESSYLTPHGKATKYDESISNKEGYDTLTRQLSLKQEALFQQIPQDSLNQLRKSWISYCLAEESFANNPHYRWPQTSFSSDCKHLLHSIHLIVICPWGYEAYQKTFPNLPFSHRVVSLPHKGCCGSFLASQEDIGNFFEGRDLKQAIFQDMEIVIDRMREKRRAIEFLSHTKKDVCPDTLFLIFEDKTNTYTKLARQHYPNNQVISILNQEHTPCSDSPSLIYSLESQSVLFPNIFLSKKNRGKENPHADLFATIRFFANMGSFLDNETALKNEEDSCGIHKAAQALFALKGPQAPQDITNTLKKV